MNVLLIEPDKVLGQAIVESLHVQAHDVVWCRTAQSALDSLDRQTPDLVILELQLGIHNGIEFLYEMRSYPEWNSIPVIVHTINANALDERFQAAFRQIGVQAVLYKPRTSTKKLIHAAGQFVAL